MFFAAQIFSPEELFFAGRHGIIRAFINRPEINGGKKEVNT